MFDGAALLTGAEVVQEQITQDHNLQEISTSPETETRSNPFTDSINLLSALSTATTPTDRQEIVFIDTTVDDYQTLLLGIDPGAETILLDPRQDGIEYIANILADRSDIDAIHLISHGSQGELRLGTGILNLASMQREYADDLAVIHQALHEEADVLIYGCNFGEGKIGQETSSLLGTLTGADIAASTNLTGVESLGGDWELELNTGWIETSIAVHTYAQDNWQGVLATYNVTNTNNSGPGSLRQAIIDSNSTVGVTDTINIPSGTYILTGAIAEEAAVSGDLDITDDVIIVGAGAATTVLDGNANDSVFHLHGTSIATISGLTIQGAIQNGGGGVLADDSSVLNLNDAIVQNNSSNLGGGLLVRGTANLNRVLFANNTASIDGGAIRFHNANGGSLTNVTISGNNVTGDGGGIWTNTPITVTNSTITLNNADDGGGIFASGATVTISNTIVSDNTATSANDDVLGSFNSNGFNLIENVGGATGFGSDLTGASANLDALADNGGPTRTHALQAGSLAINAGANQPAPSTDARNITRNEIPDIGAYESTTATSKVYWAESGGNAIYRSNTDGSAKQQLLNGLDSPTGFDVDTAGGKMYWIEAATDSLHRANLDGSNLEDLDTTNLVAPLYIGLDLVNSHIYVADSGGGTDDAIRRFNLDGSGFTTIVNNISGGPVDVAIDPIDDKIYFTNFRIALLTGKVQTTDLGGGSLADVVTGEAGTSSITIDRAGGKMYWTDNGITFKRIRAADLDGSDKQTINNSGLLSPAGITLDLVENKVYWSDKSNNFIRRSDLDGSNDEDVITGLNAPQELAVIRVGANMAPTLDLDVNDDSGATGNGYQLTFTEGDAATAIADGDTDLVDPDSTTFASVSLTINGLLDGNAEVLVFDGDTFALATAVAGQDTTNYHVVMTTGAGTATMTITKRGGGTFSEAETEALVQSIDYQHTDTSTPTNGNRLIDVIVNDGISDSTAARSTINVDPVNDPPTFTGLDHTPSFTEGGPAVALDNNATIADPELDAADSYDGATLTLVRNGGTNANDVFDGSGTLNPLVEGGNLVVGGVTIGTVTTNSGGTLVFTFNSNATTTLVNSTLQQITYRNINGTPPANVQIDYLFSDGNLGAQGSGGALNDTGSLTVTINTANTPPVSMPDGFTVNEGATNILNLTANDTDADDGLDLSSITITSGPTQGTIDSINADGTVTYTHDDSETLADSFTYTVRDLAGSVSNTTTVTLTITAQNDPPLITSNGGGNSAAVSVIQNTTTVTDVNATDPEGTPLTYSISGGADAAQFSIDSTTGALTFITAPNFQAPADVDGNNIYDVIVQTSDGTLVDTQTIAVTVTDLPFVIPPPPPEPLPESPPPSDDGDKQEELQETGAFFVTEDQRLGSSHGSTLSGQDHKDFGAFNKSRGTDAETLQLLEGARERGVTDKGLSSLLQQSFEGIDFTQDIQALLDPASGLLNSLDHARDTLKKISETEHMYVVSGLAASTGLSVGYVIWLLRSGVLLTALLSTVPAWQFVNPLLILDAPSRKRRKRGTTNQSPTEEDSLETMFEKPEVARESTEREAGTIRQPR